MSKHEMLQNSLVNRTMAFDKKRWRVFADWLKPEREKANLSQDGLADKIGVDRQTIYRLENALSGTKRETVIAIAEALNIDKGTALNMAGFALQGIDFAKSDSHEILSGVTVQFDEKVKISKKDREKILEAMGIVAKGVLATSDSNSE